MLNKYQKELVESNINLVYYIANKLGYKDEDSLQYGLYGLCKAADAYDRDRGIKFSTFAYSYISNWMRGTYSDLKFKEVLCYGDSLDFENLSYNTIENSSKEFCDELYTKASVKMKKILRMLYFGYTRTEIANCLNVSKGTITRWILKFKEDIKNERNQTI